MFFHLDFLFALVGVLLSVAFFTLMERKVMGLAHYRKGPNKVVIWGLAQPMADALKLLTKELSKLSFLKMMMFFSGPSLMILLMCLCWGWYESCPNTVSSSMKMMVIIAVMSLTAYGFMLTSWGSNSKYSLIGGYRAIAQIISYEVCLTIFMMIMIYACKTYNFLNLKMIQENMWFLFSMAPLFLCWSLMCMAESNRTPFDLAEGESEIVSGFNIEYGGGMFALIFISEYGMIMMLSFITCLVFMGASLILLKTFLFCSIYVWVRCSFPRVRYDLLMMTCWKTLLPLSVVMVSASAALL